MVYGRVMGAGGAGNKQANLSAALAAQPGHGEQGLLDAHQGLLSYSSLSRLKS
jgi:hypothetical protein